MDNQNIPQENQDLNAQQKDYDEEKKYPIGGFAPGNYTCKCCICGKEFTGDKRAVQCEPCATKLLSDDVKFKNGVVNAVPTQIEKPIFIACKEPALINKLNDFLRTFANGEENYKLLVISPEISEKLFEQYWFTQLDQLEQEALKKQAENELWHQQAVDLAKQVYDSFLAIGYSDQFESTGFEFKIHELKNALTTFTRRRLKRQQLKEIVDVLLVFGYIIKINDETTFGKLKFKLLLTSELKLKYVQCQLTKLKVKEQDLKMDIAVLEHKERELHLETIKVANNEQKPVDPE